MAAPARKGSQIVDHDDDNEEVLEGRKNMLLEHGEEEASSHFSLSPLSASDQGNVKGHQWIVTKLLPLLSSPPN